MRTTAAWLGAAAALAIALAPAAADAARVTSECKRLTRQILHFDGVVERARERDDELWEAETRRHIGRLAERRARLCPEYAEAREKEESRARTARNTARFFKAAGEVALRFFTLGAFPGF